MELPSGEQVEIGYGDARAVVTEVGAGLRSYEVGGRAVVDGYAEREQASAGRGQVLIPWPNRIAGGRYETGGGAQQLPLTEASRSPGAAGNANHGLTRWVNWRLRSRGPASVVGTYTLHPQPGYPFMLACAVAYTLGDDGLTVAMDVTNVGVAPAPVGFGCHPYVTAGTALVDDALLQVPAATRLVVAGGIPTGSVPVEGSEYDFRSPRAIGPQLLDTPYTDLLRDPDGRVRVRLAAPGGQAVTVWADGTFGYLQVFSGDTVPQPGRRRAGLAVEPMSCAPNAFVSGDGLTVLEPGATLAGEWGISPS